MCGIAGVFRISGTDEADVDRVRMMNTIQKRRGPDDEGIYEGDACVLGHRRLAVIDLSNDGRQPFSSDDGRYRLVFNGEIYNYIELRRELEQRGRIFKTKTDTEVLLIAYEEFGKECLYMFNGMFAFAVYDAEEKALFMARDRMGVKPLYYSVIGSTLYLASEMKAIYDIPGLKPSVNKQALFDYLVFNRTDIFEETFVNEIKRLPKGCHATFDEGGMRVTQWWNPEIFLDALPNETPSQAREKIRDLLVSAVRLRMRSDVPVGSCLSGGLDSSILVGILFNSKEARNGYPTFTASFPGDPMDETRYVDILGDRYPFISHRVFPSAEAALERLREFVYANDEPVTSPSFFSQYEVMRLVAEKGVTVLMDGQGGDENFAGYHYFHGFNLYGLWKSRRYLHFGRELLRGLIRRQDISMWQTLIFQLLSHKNKMRVLLKSASYLNPDFFYKHVNKSLIYKEFFRADDLNQSIVRHFQYKLEHLLRIVDRNSMAFSLEARVPYLDYRLVEYLLGLPSELKVRGGQTKLLQKEAVGQFTVPQILERKDKIGFGTPVDQWMQTDKWKEFTRENYERVKESFPDVFIKNAPLPKKGAFHWKVNQLATWKDVFNL